MSSHEAANEESLMDLCFEHDVDVETIEVEDDTAEIIAAPDAFDAMATALEAAGITASESGLVRKPDNLTLVGDAGLARQVFRLVDSLEENDDVQQVYVNADVPDHVLEELAQA